MTTTIRLPELGENVDSGELTKILVSAGDTVSKDQALLELETDKATIEVPSPVSGVIKEMHVQEGRKIRVGDALFTVEENGAAAKPKSQARQQEARQQNDEADIDQPIREERQTPSASTEGPGATNVAGASAQPKKREDDSKTQEEPQATRETKPAARESRPEKTEPRSMREKPSFRAAPQPEPQTQPAAKADREPHDETEKEETVIPFRAESPEPAKRHLAPASPSIRRLARELGVDIDNVAGTGPEGRIDEEDVKHYVRQIVSHTGGSQFPEETFAQLPDFAKWGAIERKPMSNVRRATAEHLAQAWHNVPQVTQFDSADVTELEALRSRFSDSRGSAVKITITAIALKIIASALDKFPQFAASIDMANRQIIYKRYYNIGVAVDTPYGLVVPVIRDADRKSISQLAKELGEVSEKAREKKLALEEMAGGVFTITNLGGIGGTAFSPIVNYPEVAILGISRMAIQPRQIDGSFQPRKILPLSLSYDHRLIDGADAARFLRWVAEGMEELALLLFRA